MTRPTLHLTNLSSKAQHGPGEAFAAMASPPEQVRRFTIGRSEVCALAEEVSKARAGELSPEDYRRHCEHVAAIQLRVGRLDPDRPGHSLSPGLVAVAKINGNLLSIGDGDTLVCTCARPDTGRRPAWQPFCHLEVWAPYLVFAGWDVVLYGRPLTQRDEHVIWADNGAPYTGCWRPAPPSQTALF